MITQPTRLIDVPINDITIETRRRLHIGNIDLLVASIRDYGLIQPILVTTTYKLIAGNRRIEAFRRLGRKTILCCVIENLDEAMPHLLAEIQENTCRKPFLPSEAVRAAEELLPFAALAAWRRMSHTFDLAQAQTFTQSGEALTQIAAIVDMSRPTLTKAMQIVEAAGEEPRKYEDLVHQMDRTGKVNGAYLELLRRQGRSRPPKTGATLSITLNKDGALKITAIRNKPQLIACLQTLIYSLERELTR